MYSLKKLKNQANLKKLIAFLDLYKHVLFYHSRRVKPQPCYGRLFQTQRVRKLANVSQENKTKKQEILFSVTRAGATGSTILVGCDSLDSMQKCIMHLNGDENWVNLGAIYGTPYISPKDCFCLAQLSTENTHKQLAFSVCKGVQLLLQQYLSPLLKVQVVLKWRSASNNFS